MKKTLLILGAGASKDIYQYFPTGLELIKDLNSHLTIEKKYSSELGNGSHLSDLTNVILRGLPDCKVEDIHLLKHHLWGHVRHYEHKYLRFDYEKSISIDYFLHEQIENKVLNDKSKAIAQYAISYLLIGSEEALKDILDKSPDLINKNWVNSLHQKLNGYSMSEINESLSVVSFNYERTFAHLFSLYRNSSIPADEKLSKDIHYIYGSLGELNKIPFGLKNDTTEKMIDVYGNFQLIGHERASFVWKENDQFETIIFLGFGYDEQNLANLNLTLFPKALKIGTGKGLDDKFKLNLKSKFGIEILVGTCKEIIEEYIS